MTDYDDFAQRAREASRKACDRFDEAVRLGVEKQRQDEARLAAKRKPGLFAWWKLSWIFRGRRRERG